MSQKLYKQGLIIFDIYNLFMTVLRTTWNSNSKNFLPEVNCERESIHHLLPEKGQLWVHAFSLVECSHFHRKSKAFIEINIIRNHQRFISTTNLGKSFIYIWFWFVKCIMLMDNLIMLCIYYVTFDTNHFNSYLFLK